MKAGCWACLVLGLSLAAFANSPGEPVEMRAEPSLGAVVRYGRPFQLEVELTPLDPGLQGDARLVVESGQQEVSSETPVHLGSGPQRVAVPVLSGSYGTRLKLMQGSRTLASLDAVSSSLANDNDLTVLVLSSRKSHFGYLAGYKGQVKGLQGEVRLNQPSRFQGLPDYWWAYLGQDVIVVHDLPSLKLGDAVEAVLLQWVHGGGTLVLVDNGDPAQFQGSPLAPMVQPRPAQGGIWWRRGYGCGQVVQVGAAITSEEVLGGQATRNLWRSILSGPSGLQLRKLSFDHYPKLSLLPELPTPATASLVWYLAVYVLVAVPCIYLYLRRKDQVLRLIVFVPACSLVFSVGAYLFNSLGRGRETLVRRAGIGWLVSGQQRWLLDQTSVLFSPRALSFEIDLPSQAALRPDSQVHPDPAEHVLVARGRQMSLPRERLRQWGVSRWRSLSLQEFPGPLRFRCHKDGTRWVVEVENQTGQDLPSALLALDANQLSAPFSIPRGTSQHQATLTNTSLEQFLQQPPLEVAAEEATGWRGQLDALGWQPSLLIALPGPASFDFKGIAPRQLGYSLLLVREAP